MSRIDKNNQKEEGLLNAPEETNVESIDDRLENIRHEHSVDPVPGAPLLLPLTINGGIQLAQNDKGPMGLASGL